MYKSNVKGKVYRLLYKLNENIRVKVRTPVGESEWADTGPGVAQGSVSGAVVSAVSLDNGVKEFFHNDSPEDTGEDKDNNEEENADELVYGEVVLKPILFQDDGFEAANSVESAQLANDKMEKLGESKILTYNLEKCSYLIMGEKKARKKLQSQINMNPLTLCQSKMKQVMKNKYLGCMLAASVSQSVSETVGSRIGIAKRAIYEIRTIIEDSRANYLGAIEVGLNLWDVSVIPMLLFSSEVWTDIPTKVMKQLDDLGTLFLRNLFGVNKRGCPTVSLYLQTSTFTMSNRILLSQLLFYHHVATLSEDSLAREFFEEQKKDKELPGLVRKCEEILKKWNILNVQSYSKMAWKRLMKQMTRKKNTEDLLFWSESYKKVDTEK